jgi:metal-responsive CopG/Arc/MetJ family transcriptional regulator
MELVVKTPHHTTVRLPLEMRQRVEALAEARQTSTSLIIREAIEHFFDAKRGRSESELRHLRVTEYVQIAMDHIIRQDYPEDRDRLIALTDLRMEQHHGASRSQGAQGHQK